MRVVNVGWVLRNNGFRRRPDTVEQRHNDLWHWFKHCFGFLAMFLAC
jgi:hypothetical protein